MAYKVCSSQQVQVMRLRLAGAVMPSARLICLSFIGQNRPQGKVSWFSHSCEKAHSLLRTEVPCSTLPTLQQTQGPPRHRNGGGVGR